MAVSGILPEAGSPKWKPRLTCLSRRTRMATAPSSNPEQPDVAPVQALNRLVDIITSYCATQAFVAACKLGVFERLSKAPATAEDVAAEVKIHPVGCRRLLVALAQLGLVEHERGLYRNSP